MVNIYITETTIDTTEISNVLTRGSKVLADLAIEQSQTKLYGMKDNKACLRRMLYLYLYAVESWSACEGGYNYITEEQLKTILAEIENLFRTCVNTNT